MDAQQLGRMEEKLDHVVKLLEGADGQSGLNQRVQALERWRSGIAAVMAFLTLLVGYFRGGLRGQ